MNESEKIANAQYFEGMTSIRAVLKGAELGINDRNIEKIYYDSAQIKSKARELSYLKKMATIHNFEIEYIDRKTIDRMCVGTSHGGVIAKCGDRTFSSALPSSLEDKKFFVMLDGIEDPFNFGYSLRSLYAFGIDGLILPERNWMSAAPIVCRSSAGASELCQIYSVDPDIAVDHFKALGASVIATAKENSRSISEIDIKFPLLLIVGGEKRGISKKTLAKADHIARIDYSRNFMCSLSAASAAAILGYEISKYL
ncbi:MAG: RNA methyltransferase [Clostridia bacterium]|nr:RNA methyltransferase [Clostridia bacterium]